jgi:nicotinamidase-related amidase
MTTSIKPTATSLARLRADDTVLLLVDVQEKFLPVIHEFERVEKNCALLLRVAAQLQIPVLITEQYPERLGATLPSLREIVPHAQVISKLRFSACVESTRAELAKLNRKTVLLCGIEAHVCVLQTALDLAEQEYSVFAARDAISSRTPENLQVGWERMMRAGVLPTSTESATFELLQEAGTPDFKALLAWIK